MANRYLVATGNWSSTSVWSATSGGSSGASVPTASDDVFISANYTVTLNANAECATLFHTNGTLSLSSYTLSIKLAGLGFFESSGSTARTINMGSGSLIIEECDHFTLSGSNLTFNAGTSRIVLNYVIPSVAWPVEFNTLDKTFNNVEIILDDSDDEGIQLNVTGSPTFNSLSVKSNNSAAHSVIFDDNSSVNYEKFVAIGSSTTNRLFLGSPDEFAVVYFDPTSALATTYGQFLDVDNIDTSSPTIDAGPYYMGSNSIVSGIGSGWLLQDPPEASSLVDPLTTSPGSNTNWSTVGTVEQATSGSGGGGYILVEGADIISTDTYDVVDDSFVFEVNDILGVTLKFITEDYEHSLVQNKYYRLSVSSAGAYLLENSDTGSSWTNVVSSTISNPDLYRSMRIIFDNTSAGPDTNSTIGSINPSLAFEATITQTAKAAVGQSFSSEQQETATIVQNSMFSYGVYDELPIDNAPLENPYTDEDYEDVAAIDNVFVEANISNGYGVHMFISHADSNNFFISPTWVGKTARPASTSPITMQIYNLDSDDWETIAVNNTAAGGEVITLNASVTTNLSDYYDANNFCYVRVYQ